MTGPVRSPSPADQAWAALAAELTPAKSLARVDTITARAVTTVTVVGVLLTGLGALSAGLLTRDTLARGLTTAAVAAAALAVACALAAQILSVTRHLNPRNLTEVKAWYWRQFRTRAYPTQAATVLLLLAALLAGGAAAAALTASQATVPTITATQTLAPVSSDLPDVSISSGQVTVTVTFRGLAQGQAATLTLTSVGRVLSRGIATPAADGTAAIALTASHLTVGQAVTLTARDPRQSCQAALPGGSQQPSLACQSR